MTTLRFTTESGSIYEIQTTSTGAERVRRINPDATKRADGEWIGVTYCSPIEIGSCVLLGLESLSLYGPDDEGHEVDGGATIRRTSPVTSIQESPVSAFGDSSGVSAFGDTRFVKETAV